MMYQTQGCGSWHICSTVNSTCVPFILISQQLLIVEWEMLGT